MSVLSNHSDSSVHMHEQEMIHLFVRLATRCQQQWALWD